MDAVWLTYNGYNGGWPSARLFGWSAADWSRPATNKSISSERKRKSLLFSWERKSWTSWLLTCCSKKGWAAEKSTKKGVNRKEKCFLSSQTRWSWRIKRACTSFLTCCSGLFIFTRTSVTYARTIFMPRCCLNFQSMRTQAESTNIAHNMIDLHGTFSQIDRLISLWLVLTSQQ